MREGDESEDEQRDSDQGERGPVEEAGVFLLLLHDGPVAVMVMGRGGPVALGYVVVDVTLAWNVLWFAL